MSYGRIFELDSLFLNISLIYYIQFVLTVVLIKYVQFPEEA